MATRWIDPWAYPSDKGFVSRSTYDFFRNESSVYDRTGIDYDDFIVQTEFSYRCICQTDPEVIHIHYAFENKYPYTIISGLERLKFDSDTSDPEIIPIGTRVQLWHFDPAHFAYLGRKKKQEKALQELENSFKIEPETAKWDDVSLQQLFEVCSPDTYRKIQNYRKGFPNKTFHEVLTSYTDGSLKI